MSWSVVTFMFNESNPEPLSLIRNVSHSYTVAKIVVIIIIIIIIINGNGGGHQVVINALVD